MNLPLTKKGKRISLSDETPRPSEDCFRTLFEESPLGISIATDGVTRYVNRACLRLFGYSYPSEMIGTSQLHRVAPDYRRIVAEKITERSGGMCEPNAYEIEALKKDGTSFPLRIHAVRTMLDGEPATIAFLDDLTDRKQVENHARESERRMADIIDFLPDAAFIIDKDGKVLAWNGAMEVMTGVKSEDMIGKGNYEYALPFYGERRPILIDLALHPDLGIENKYVETKRRDANVVGEAYMPALRGGLRGGEVYLLGTASVLRDSKGNITGAIETIHDLTARRKAELGLRNTMEFNREIIHNAQDGIIVYDRSLNYTAWNRVMEERTGLTEAEVIGKHSLELFPHLKQSGVDRLLTRALQGETVASGDLLFHSPNGEKWWISGLYGPHRDAKGNIIGVIGVVRDVTEKVKADTALREKERHYRLLFESANDGIFILSNDVIVDCNSRALELFCTNKDTLLGNAPWALSPDVQPDGRNSAEKALECLRMAAEGALQLFEWRHRRPDGTLFDAEISLSRFEAADGKRMVLAMIRDITERKIIEKEKSHLQLQLMQAHKLEAIGTLAGGIAHDFNNVLMAIVGFSELAGIEGNEMNRRECLDQVLTACGRAKDLIGQILTFSRIREMESRPVQVNQIVKEGMKLLRSSIPTTIDICVNVDAQPVVVLADPTQIHQVLMNLGTNAWHAMRERGGVLSLSLSVGLFTDDRETACGGLPGGQYAKLQVSDTGIGMTEAVKARIFEPFFTTKPQGEGTGLGLSVVYGIVKACKGEIKVESRPGKGTTVTVWLPVADENERADNSEKKAAPAGHERILFVDDEPMLADLGKRMLQSLGYRVTKRTSSLDALEYFRKHPEDVDLVITDITMPNMTGADLAQKMLEIRKDVPIILCTGYSEMVSEEKAKRIGARAYIMKPVTRADLARTVREALDAPRKRRKSR